MRMHECQSQLRDCETMLACPITIPTHGCDKTCCAPCEADVDHLCDACLREEAMLVALRDLRESVTDAYKSGRIPAEPFVRAGNVIAEVTGA